MAIYIHCRLYLYRSLWSIYLTWSRLLSLLSWLSSLSWVSLQLVLRRMMLPSSAWVQSRICSSCYVEAWLSLLPTRLLLMRRLLPLLSKLPLLPVPHLNRWHQHDSPNPGTAAKLASDKGSGHKCDIPLPFLLPHLGQTSDIEDLP